MSELENQSETDERPSTPAEPVKSARLTAEQEEEASQLARELLLAGDASIPTAVEALVSLPWSVGVTVLKSVWPELSPDAHNLVTTALSEQKSDSGKRLRLSVARGLLGMDAEAVEKITTDVCAEMRAEGELGTRDRMMFANVLIGKGKPWLLQLPVAEWRSADALIACAVDTCFAGPCPPFTQIALLRWLAGLGQLEKLDENALALIAKSAKRWSARFQRDLKKEVPDLPAAIAEAMTSRARESSGESAPEESEETDDALDRLVASARAERRAQPREQARDFDLSRALREIESHVTSLKKELHEARMAVRQREGKRPQRGQPAGEEHWADVEDLQRHNAQLQETVAELRARLDELAADHEDRAAAADVTDDTRAQLLELLGLKLRESFAEFEALRSNAADEVVRQHFGDMLAAIFKVLEEEGVRLR